MMNISYFNSYLFPLLITMTDLYVVLENLSNIKEDSLNLIHKNINKYEITPKLGEGIKSAEIKKIYNITKNKFKKIRKIGPDLVEII
jgi:hypothetical protein